MAARDDAIVRVQPLGDQWQSYGTESGRGITVEGLKLGADDWGPHDFACSLGRDPGVAWADLQAACPIEVEIGGSLLFGGRISETPTSEINRQISVQGEGTQFNLDDDVYQSIYVHSKLDDWGDVRSNQNANLAVWQEATAISNDSTGITLTLANGRVRALSTGGGVFLDLGPNNLSARVIVSWAHSANSAGSGLFVYASNTIAGLASPSAFGTITASMVGTASGTSGFTLGPYRYLMLVMADTINTTLTPGADIWAKFSAVSVFTSTAYESGNVSVLFASTVIKDALTRAPLVGADQSLIAATAFAIPDLVMSTYQTPRQVANAVNAYHSYQARVRADGRFEFRPRPAAPLLQLVNGTFEDTSAGSLDQVYNKCVSLATGPDGIQIVSTQTVGGTIIGRRGYTKTNVLDTNMSLTQAGLDQMCSTFLSSHARTPFKGTLTVTGFEAVAFMVGGAYVPAWELLQYVGELIHFPNLTDPDTGAKGRDGRISAVTYDHDTRTASVSIDSQRNNFEALLARLQIVAGTVT